MTPAFRFTGTDADQRCPRGPQRLMSLDLFRGVTIAAMILVNDPGDGPSAYWPLKHSDWNGWTPTDLVFPFFLFIVGVAMAFSFRSRLNRGESRRAFAAACAVAWVHPVCPRHVSEWISQSLSSCDMADLRRVAANRHLLRHHSRSSALDRMARANCRRRRMSGGILDSDAIRPRAGIRRSHSRYSVAGSRPQCGGVARSQAADGSPV